MQKNDSKNEPEVVIDQIEEREQPKEQTEEIQEKEEEKVHASTSLFLDETEIEKLEETVMKNEKKSTDEIVENGGTDEVLEKRIDNNVSEIDKGKESEDEIKTDNPTDNPTNKEIPPKREPVATTNYFTLLAIIIVTFLVTWGFFSVNNENLKTINKKKIDLLSVDIMTLKKKVTKLQQENKKLRSGIKSIIANTQKELEILLDEKKESTKIQSKNK